MPAVAMLAIIIGFYDTIRPLLEMFNLQFLHFGSSTSDRVHHILYNDETQTGNYTLKKMHNTLPWNSS